MYTHAYTPLNTHTHTELTGLCLLSQDLSEEVVTRILSDVKIPEYRPSQKVSLSVPVFDFHQSVKKRPNLVDCCGSVSPQCIETDETARKPDQIKMPLSSEEEREAITQLEQAIATDGVTAGWQLLDFKSETREWR